MTTEKILSLSELVRLVSEAVEHPDSRVDDWQNWGESWTECAGPAAKTLRVLEAEPDKLPGLIWGEHQKHNPEVLDGEFYTRVPDYIIECSRRTASRRPLEAERLARAAITYVEAATASAPVRESGLPRLQEEMRRLDAWARAALANALRTQGRLDDAETEMIRARECLVDPTVAQLQALDDNDEPGVTESRDDTWFVRWLSISLARDRGEHDRAMKDAAHLLVAGRRITNFGQWDHAALYVTAAEAFREGGQLNAAIKLYVSAARVTRSSKTLLAALHSLSLALLDSSRYAEATAVFQISEPLYTLHANPWTTGLGLWLGARLNAAGGAAGQAVERASMLAVAEQALQMAVVTFEEGGLAYDAALAALELAELRAESPGVLKGWWSAAQHANDILNGAGELALFHSGESMRAFESLLNLGQASEGVKEAIGRAVAAVLAAKRGRVRRYDEAATAF